MKIKCDTCGGEFYPEEIITFAVRAGESKVEHICLSCLSKELNYVNFGDITRKKLGIQCQYASRYVHGKIEGWPYLGKDLRFKNDPINDYHSLQIHKDDVEEFVRRVKGHCQEREKL